MLNNVYFSKNEILEGYVYKMQVLSVLRLYYTPEFTHTFPVIAETLKLKTMELYEIQNKEKYKQYLHFLPGSNCCTS